MGNFGAVWELPLQTDGDERSKFLLFLPYFSQKVAAGDYIRTHFLDSTPKQLMFELTLGEIIVEKKEIEKVGSSNINLLDFL